MHHLANIYENLRTTPADWKDLQNKVARLLSEIGYDCEVEKDIQTTRETINVDVYAIIHKDIPHSKILCECKHWIQPVPKTIVHAFRTAVGDFGANYGIIISKAGFQSGAYEAAKNTNILLMNWEEFEEYFKTRWIKSKTFQVSRETRPLYDYISAGFLVFFKEQYQKLSPEELKMFDYLNTKYFHFAFHGSNLNYKDFNTNEFDNRLFDTLYKSAEKEFGQSFSSLEDYYRFIVEKSKEGIQEFDNLFKEKLRKNDCL